LSVV